MPLSAPVIFTVWYSLCIIGAKNIDIFLVLQRLGMVAFIAALPIIAANLVFLLG